jgi:hypothetical protein
MKNLLLLLLVVGLTSTCFSQNNHVLLLKDRGVSIKNFVEGNYIRFQFSSRQWITGHITKIDKDSVTINQFTLQTTYNSFGFQTVDTLKLGRFTFGASEILGFAKENGHHESVITNGAMLRWAGGLLIGANLINSLIEKQAPFGKDNLPTLGGGLGLWILGKIQGAANPNFRPIGKRYTVEIL